MANEPNSRSAHREELKLVQDRSYALGTNISVTVAHPDVAVAKTAIAAALQEVHSID